MADTKQQTRPKRIFINDLDRYSSKHIAKVAKQVANPSFFNILHHMFTDFKYTPKPL